jgi:hypothetical protein
MAREKVRKARGERTYRRKCAKLMKWYEHIEKNRQEKNGKGIAKKALRPIEFFMDKLKQPNKRD